MSTPTIHPPAVPLNTSGGPRYFWDDGNNGRFWRESTFDGILGIDQGGTAANTIGEARKNLTETRTVLVDDDVIAVDCSEASKFEVTLEGTGREIELTNDVDGQRIEILIKQDDVGARTITVWPTGIRWAGGVAPTLTATEEHWDIVVLLRESAGVYLGFVAKNFY